MDRGTDGFGAKAQLFDYGQAANPIRPGLTEPIPYRRWDPSIHSTPGDGANPPEIIATGIWPLDLSKELGCDGPATSPGLAAHFVGLRAGSELELKANATSSLAYVLRGSGRCRRDGSGSNGAGQVDLSWTPGDLFVLPAGEPPRLGAEADSLLYWVHDGPLLAYLGVEASQPRFDATLYKGAWMHEQLAALAAEPGSARSNRISLLLANLDLPSTRTVTHTLWAMLGIVPAGAVQPAHRHQSVALDLITECEPGCYTLVGTDLNGDGTIKSPTRIDWQAGGAFITPPGHWHAHYNESGTTAYLLPIQDAGIQTYLRSLDIRFARQGN